MLVQIQAAQQAQTANPDAAPNSQQSQQQLREQIRETIRAAREAAADARDAQREANQVRVQNGVPVPPVPAIPPMPVIPVHTGVPGDMIPPQLVDIAIGFFVMCAMMVIGWPLARAFGRRLERSGPAAAVSPAVNEQLQRIEQAVEAMAIEVERISESQRYLTKLQSAPRNEPAACRRTGGCVSALSPQRHTGSRCKTRRGGVSRDRCASGSDAEVSQAQSLSSAARTRGTRIQTPPSGRTSQKVRIEYCGYAAISHRW